MWPITLLWALAVPSLVAAMPLTSESSLETRRVHTNMAILAQFDFQPYQLTNICLDCNRSDVKANYSCEVKFDWFDPNSVRQNNVSSTTCNQTWSWDGVTPIGGDENAPGVPYVPCWQDASTVFAMGLVAFEEPGNFTLQLSHLYHDDENFTAPYDYPTTFSQPTILLPLVDKSDVKLSLATKGPVNANITGLSD